MRAVLRIDDKLELGRLLDRQVRRLGALEDAADIDAHLPIRVHDVGSVAHQSADLADVARAGCHGERMARRPIGQLQPPAIEKCVLADEQGVGSLASKSREGGVDLADRAGVEDLDLQSHGAARRFHLAQA